jgi:hypothetical protein
MGMNAMDERKHSPLIRRHNGPEQIDRERAEECWEDMQTVPSSLGGMIEVLATWFRMVRDEPS